MAGRRGGTESKMKSHVARRTILAAALWAAAGALALAAEKSYKCPLDTQTCLDRMVAKLEGSGWLGIHYEEQSSGEPRITRIIPGSPAEKGGLEVGDVLVSIQGARYADNTDERCVTCEGAKDAWKPGGKVEYVVRREGKLVRVSATLAPLPPDVLAMMLGMHMLEHVTPEPSSP